MSTIDITEIEDDRILNISNILEDTEGGIIFFAHAIPELRYKPRKCPNVHNPFYEDTKPSFSVYQHKDKWYYKDFGNSDFHGDVFNFAALYYKLDLKKDFYLILQKICTDLELRLIYDKNYHPYPSFEYSSKNKDGKSYKVYYKSDFSEKELAFWGQYGITKNTLDLFNVKPVFKYVLIKPDNETFKFKPTDDKPVFAYEISENCLKLYKPFEAKFRFQWLGEKPIDYCFGWDEINALDCQGRIIYLTGGEKDVMTLYELGFPAFSLNSETGSIPEKILSSETFIYNQINILYDIDETGIKSSEALSQKHGLNRILLPGILITAGGKDISDYVKLKLPLNELDIVIKGERQLSGFEIVIPTDEPKSKESECQAEESVLYNPEEETFPLILDEIEENLPEFLRECCSNFKSKRERDIFLYSALVVLSACLPNLHGYYDNRKVYSNLYLFIIAPPASNKSVAKWAKQLGVSLHSRFGQLFQESMCNYSTDVEKYNASKDNSDAILSKPEKPTRKFLYIPANASSAAFLQLISGNNERGLLFETEADILSDTLSKEWGNYNTFLRDAYHHEQHTYARKTNNEFVELNEPKLSAVLTGTPNQVNKLISDVDNGLFSRFMFYRFEENPIWKDVFIEKDKGMLSRKFFEYAIEIQNLFFKLESSPYEINFSLTEEQEKMFNHILAIRLNEFVSKWGNGGSATIKRLGLIAFRLAMILSIIRRMNNDKIEENIVCAEEDFWASMIISENLMIHASLVYNLLPQKNEKLKGISEHKLKYFEELPIEFSRKDADKLAEKLNIKLKTAEKYLGDFINDKLIIRLEHGKYKKAA